MKSLSFKLIILLLLIGLDLGAQTKEKRRLSSFNVADSVMAKTSGNQKSIFSDYITGVGSLLSTNSGALDLHGTIYGIKQAVTGHAKDTLDFNYVKHVWQRNTQINFGLSPDKKKELQVDTLTYGVTITILNNKIAKNKIVNHIASEYSTIQEANNSIDLPLLTLYNQLSASTNNSDIILSNQLNSFMTTQGDTTTIDSVQLRTLILNSTGRGYLSEVFADYKRVNREYFDMVAKQWLWTITINGKHDFVKNVSAGLTISSTASKVFFISKNEVQQFSFQFTPSYVLTNDSTKAAGNSGRRYASLNGGMNFKVCKRFETNIIGSWTHILDGQYKKEKVDQYAISVTPRIKISDNFWLPITIKYDIVHPQFFGFISIQYSLKATK